MCGPYIETPYLPQKPVKIALIDGEIDEGIIQQLQEREIKLIKTIKCKELYRAVQWHPDMVIQPMGGDDIVIAPNVINYYKPILIGLGFNVIEGNTYLKRNYPDNIAYNICIVGNYLIHNLKYTDDVILKHCEKNKYLKIHVSQGYSKCSVAVINDRAIITSDIGIHKEVQKFGIDSLLVNPEGIFLSGLNYGFIGGTCGYLNNKVLAFYGNIKNHKDFKKINCFLKKHNKSFLSLANNNLRDFGSLIPLMEMV